MMRTLTSSLTYQGIPIWRHVQILQWTTQIVSGILVVTLVVWLLANIGNAIQDRNIPYGFGFLDQEYLTPIGQFYLPYSTHDTYLYAFFVAFVNTLIVSVIGVVFATGLGIVIGVARMSGNWIVAKAALGYVEFFRNVPLLVQLYFWLELVLLLPEDQDGYVIADSVYLNNAGLSLPWPVISDLGPALAWLGLAATAVIVGILVYRQRADREVRTGAASYPILTGSLTALIVGAAGWLAVAAVSGGAPFGIAVPEPQGAFGRIDGGFEVAGAMMALLAGLVMYTASFIAEIVRSGLQSVNRGQRESARALGLSWGVSLRHVTFPQALRVIVPPLISQYLNLTKNSSLAAAIGFSDLFGVAETMTQKAPAVSIFLMVMVAYLALSLTYSIIGNLYNRTLRR